MHFPDYSKTANRVIGNILREQAATQPEQVFLAADERRFTYAETLDLAMRYAAGMQAQGLGKDDRVCLFMGSSPEFVLLALGANLAGIQWIPVNTDYRGEWLEQTLADSRPSLLITDAHYAGRLAELPSVHCERVAVDGEAEALAPVQFGLEALLAESATGFEPVDIDRGDVAAVMWTSGTTGRSKGVMQSHNAWVRAALSSAEMSDIRDGDVIYNCLPLYNSAAWVTGIYPALVAGVTCAMDPAFSASHFWDRTRYYGATHVFTLGAMHMFLWDAPEKPDDADNPVRVAYMVPMPEEMLHPFRQRFGIEAIHQGFGQSEIMLLIRRCDDGRREWQPNALGEPADDIEVALLGDDNRPVAVGDVGEVCVKPKDEHILFNGYFNDPEATAAAFTDGWYHTGDLARQDEEGNYYFVDRKKDLIRYKGRSVSSVAIESVARRQPGVAGAAAFGIPSQELASEHEIMLAVVREPGQPATEEEIARFINHNAPYFFVPRYIEFVDALPLTPTQKVRKNILRERGVTENTWDARAAGFEVER